MCSRRLRITQQDLLTSTTAPQLERCSGTSRRRGRPARGRPFKSVLLPSLDLCDAGDVGSAVQRCVDVDQCREFRSTIRINNVPFAEEAVVQSANDLNGKGQRSVLYSHETL